MKISRRPPQPRRAERVYAKQLARIAAEAGKIIAGMKPEDLLREGSLEQIMQRYAEELTPWAIRTASAMIADVNGRDIASWRALSGEISKGLQAEIIGAPIGDVLRGLLDLQVGLIKSIPLDAAKRVHKLAGEAMLESARAKEVAREIMNSSGVAKSRAMLIARTEVARTKATLQQARAQAVGSNGYIWRTSKDGDVRPSHRGMNGKFVSWNAPPTLDGMSGHAGCLPNCRCFAQIVLPE